MNEKLWSEHQKTKMLTENWRKFLKEEVEQVGDYTIVQRSDGKTVLIHKDTFDHIGTHQKPGIGSVFFGNITPEILINQSQEVHIEPTGGFSPSEIPGSGAELVKPLWWVKKNLPDAQFDVTHKDDYDPVKQEKIKVPVVAAKTSKPIDDPLFATDEVSIGIFKYDPERATPQQNEFIKNNPSLTQSAQKGNLFALVTAFPGGSEIEDTNPDKPPGFDSSVPRSTEWGGPDPEKAKWAVIIPSGG